MESIFQNKRIMVLFLVIAFGVFFFSGCKKNEESLISEKLKVDKKNITAVIEELSSEKYQGRKTGTSGEAEASLYLARSLKDLGIKPYKGDDYFQGFKVSQSIVKEKDKRYYLEVLNTSLLIDGDNVLGILKDPERHKYIVISANYDHLGIEPSGKRRIFPGANQNASGVSSVLEIARILSENFSKMEYNLVFAFWSGHEQGMAGSREFVNRLSETEKNNIEFVINLDTIGAFGEKSYIIWKEDNSARKTIDEMKTWEELSIKESARSLYNSDHYYFSQAGIPAISILSENWIQGTGAYSDSQYGVNTENIRILTQYVVNYLFNLEGEKDV